MLLTEYIPTIVDTIWPFSFVLTTSFLFYIFQDKIRGSFLEWGIPLVFFIISVVFEYNLITDLIAASVRSFKDVIATIPMHLCSMSVFLMWFYYITKKTIYFEILIFQGVIGAMVTFSFPDVEVGPSEYYYWTFLFSHSILFLMPVYFWIIDRKIITKKSFLYAIIAFHIFGILALFINLYTDTNYMYINPDNTVNILSFLPAQNIIPFFGNWPGVLVFGELLSLTVYGVVFGIILLLQKVVHKSN